MPTGAELITEERRRQIEEEGMSPARDMDLYHDNELRYAAMCYLYYCGVGPDMGAPSQWPWNASWWKPSVDDPTRDLAKAGALIAAEIDRLLNRRAEHGRLEDRERGLE